MKYCVPSQRLRAAQTEFSAISLVAATKIQRNLSNSIKMQVLVAQKGKMKHCAASHATTIEEKQKRHMGKK